MWKIPVQLVRLENILYVEFKHILYLVESTIRCIESHIYRCKFTGVKCSVVACKP